MSIISVFQPKLDYCSLSSFCSIVLFDSCSLYINLPNKATLNKHLQKNLQTEKLPLALQKAPRHSSVLPNGRDCIRMGFDPKFNHPKQLILVSWQQKICEVFSKPRSLNAQKSPVFVFVGVLFIFCTGSFLPPL